MNRDGDGDNTSWILSGGYFRCSVCNEKALLKLDKSCGGYKEYRQIRSRFCPYCGRKMESDIKIKRRKMDERK